MAITIDADLDGDKQTEIVQGTGSHTQVLKAGALVWQHDGWIDGWNRGDNDVFALAADVDGDSAQEVLVVNNSDHWTGLFKWQGGALHTIWASPSPIDGWNRTADDQFLAADVDADGHQEIAIYNNADGWTGVLKWEGAALHTIWGSPSPLQGPAGQWNRRASDEFSVTDYGGHPAIAILHPDDGWHGVLLWQSNALQPVQITKDKDTKEGGQKEPGEKEPGEKEPGEKEPGDKDPGEKEPGDKDPGEKEPGEKEPGEKEPGEKEPGEPEGAGMADPVMATEMDTADRLSVGEVQRGPKGLVRTRRPIV